MSRQEFERGSGRRLPAHRASALVHELGLALAARRPPPVRTPRPWVPSRAGSGAVDVGTGWPGCGRLTLPPRTKVNVAWGASLPLEPLELRDELDPGTCARLPLRCGSCRAAPARPVVAHFPGRNGHKHDLRWWNLVARCQRSNLWLQRPVQIERVYRFEHGDYFKRYAADWYAYAYLGENLSRDETMERLNKLLALERVA